MLHMAAARRRAAGRHLVADAEGAVRPIPVCYTGRLRSSSIALMELAVPAHDWTVVSDCLRTCHWRDDPMV